MIYSIFATILIYTVEPLKLPNELNYMIDPEKVVLFANHLYTTKNYEASITEYERAIFLGATDTSAILLKIGRAYSLLGNYEKARKCLARVANDTALAIIGFTWLENKEIKMAETSFTKIKDESWRRELDKECLKLLTLPYKSPLVAGFSSAIIPGTGRAYSGRLGDGIFSFIFTIGSFTLSCQYYRTKDYPQSVALGLIGALFYLGDIYGSVVGAELYNEKVYYDTLEEFKKDFSYLY
ncbi:MAG: tetratricopeptide repeat protein [bacterium]|nr:tetratricopeptide repeat protein [bacterium]